MNVMEEQADNVKTSNLYWKPLSWLGTIRPSSTNYAFDTNLWATFVSTTLGLETKVATAWTFTTTTPAPANAHSGATKTHDWMVGSLGQLFRMAGHTVRTQLGITASTDQLIGDVEISNYLQDATAAGAWSSTCP